MNFRKATAGLVLGLTLVTSACSTSSYDVPSFQPRQGVENGERGNGARDDAQDYMDRANEVAGEVTSFMEEAATAMVEEMELDGSLAPTPTVGTDYDRDAFGPAWADTDQNGCDTRNDILARDLTDLVIDEDSCTVLFGTLDDPYTGETYFYERGHSNTDIDHIVPLAAAWRMGADSWPEAKRIAFANDPANLAASYMGANRSKGDRTPSEWMPANTEFHCSYVRQFLTVATAYNLTVTRADLAVADRVC